MGAYTVRDSCKVNLRVQSINYPRFCPHWLVVVETFEADQYNSYMHTLNTDYSYNHTQFLGRTNPLLHSYVCIYKLSLATEYYTDLLVITCNYSPVNTTKCTSNLTAVIEYYLIDLSS